MGWTIRYYNEKVQLTVDAWPVGIRAVYARITERMLIFGPSLGMPLTRSMGNGLFEIRARGREGLGRALFCTKIGQEIVILHAFTKKTQRTPPKELEVARRRLHEVRSHDS